MEIEQFPYYAEQLRKLREAEGRVPQPTPEEEGEEMLVGSESEDTVSCPICFDDVPESVSVTLGCCDTSYCLVCLQRFVFEYIQAGKVDEVRCPNPMCEDGAWDLENVEAVFQKYVVNFEMGEGRKMTRAGVVQRFVRFKMLADAQDDELVLKKRYVCRNAMCDGVLVPSDGKKNDGGEEEEGEGAKEGVILCRLCKEEHCAECFLIHQANEKCADAKKRAKQEDYKKTDKYRKRKEMKIAARAFFPTVFTRLSLAVKPNVKRCPTCHKFIEKYYGCKHMHCSSCKTDFCWVCRTPSNGDSHCTLQKVIWPVSLLAAITFSAVYVPVMVLPWAVMYNVEKNLLEIPRNERRHKAIWDQFYFVNEMLAAFPYSDF
jgi:hypothetical protein